MPRVLLALALLSGSSALGQERVRIAVLPLVSPGVDDAQLAGELDAEVKNILVETQHLTVVSEETVARRLKEEPSGRCAPHGRERVECLERIALTTRAVYALLVWVKRLGKEYEVGAVLADADRVPLKQPETLTVRDDGAVKLAGALKHQLRMLLLDRAKIGQLPVDARARDAQAVGVTPPVAAVEPPPAIPPPFVEAPPESMSARKKAGFVMLGVGAIGLAIGGGLMAAGTSTNAGTMDPQTGYILPGRVADVQKAKVLETAAGVALGVGVAAAVAGVVMVTVPGGAAEVSLAPTRGGAMVGLRGALP
ncbi:MAG: hypothetical protein IPJ65_28615 [Archangiaceae bacterium]|nr:hypothetical protein [Archangiaceae bacterium]